MPLIHETLSEQFYEWEIRGRGWTVWPYPVRPEPPFRPFYRFLPQVPNADDGRRPTFLSSLVAQLAGNAPSEQEPVADEEPEPEPEEFVRESLVEFETCLPAMLDISNEAFAQFLRNLSRCREAIAFEIVGVPGSVKAQFAVGQDDAATVRRQLQSHFPDAVFKQCENVLEDAWHSSESDDVLIVEFGLDREFMFPLATSKLDSFVGIVAALSELKDGEVGVFQVIFEPIKNDWADNILRSVTDSDGKPFFVNMPEIAKAGETKIRTPLFAAVVRIGVKNDTYDGAVSLARDLAGALSVFGNPLGNSLIPLSNEEYPFDDHVEDLLRRQSRRSGMILGADELTGFVHIPGSAIRSPAFIRETDRTKAAPPYARNPAGLFLGENVHLGELIPVRITDDQRSRHVHIIGSSGTGKSTLLVNLIRECVQKGEGLALLDPHGDLVDEILGNIPTERIDDIVLIDPSDEKFFVGFNILSAHSDLEKNLLASDLVSVFQRLSTNWGDQMGIVLQNAILAFLESDKGGTLSDMRRFLIEPAFRERFLSTVRDPDILYYWRHAFKELSGNRSIGPVITRLETFLAPKPIRYMVAQKENRIDFAGIMDSGKIFLAKLPQGQIGKENSFLLGSLLVSKFQQIAMSRQAKRIETRRLFTLFVDEVQNFITPSMAEILSGARKYKLSLVLAHQELRQLERDREVASAVLSNPHTRIAFRVGDHDSRTLENGFSYFEARDLQNLETGQAICRIERADGDFNIAIPPPEKGSEAEAEKRREEIITASRKKYALSREAVEALLAAALAESMEQKKEPPVAKPRPQTFVSKKKSPQAPESIIEEDPASSPVPVTPVAPVAPESAIPVQAQEDTVPEPKPQIPDKGIGGHQHNLIRERIEAIGRELGYSTSREKHTGDGGKIDVVLEKQERAIACEIAITTTIDHEVGNVAKCIKAGFRQVVVLSPTLDRLQKIEQAVRASLSKEDADRVSYHQPDLFIAFLRARSLEDNSTPAAANPTERKIGKYKVKRSTVALTAEELKEREAAALSILAETMRKKK